MRGHWHLIALTVLLAALSVILNINLFLLAFIWLFYLFYDKRISLLTFSLAILSFFYYFHHIPSLEIVASEELVGYEQENFHGKIVSEPVFNSNKIELVIEETTLNQRIIILYFPNDEEINSLQLRQLKYGAACSVIGELELPAEATNPGQFNYQKYLLTKNISYQIVLKELTNIECEGSLFFQRFYTLRLKLLDEAPSKLSPYTRAWLKALVLGERSEIDEQVLDTFQRWSLSHLLAISGLHIGIIVAIVYFGLVKLNLLTKEKAETIVLLSLPIYAVLAGGQPSVLRAVFMVVLLLLAKKMQIKFYVQDVISLVFLILIFFQPYLIYHIGFQFSFVVTFGIILTKKWLATVPSSAYQILMISFVSQIVILPLQLDYFSILQPLSIILNLLVVPYFSLFVIPFMFILLLLSFLPNTLLAIFDNFFIGTHHIVITMIQWVDRWLDFPLFLTDIPLWFYLIYYVILLTAFFYLQNKRSKHAFIAFLLLISLIIGYASTPYLSPRGYVTMLDIGQGDAFIIEQPHRRGVYMIDAGARFSFEDMEPTNTVYKQVIQPYLRSKGIHKIDALFLTHDDLDHIGSVKYMIEDGVVEDIFVSEYFPVNEQFLEEIERSKVNIYSLTQGKTIKLNEQSLTVLSPIRDKQKSNENSLVLYTEIGGKTWLFTGDITKEEEKELIKKYKLNVDVLKVAHHGSSTSTDQDFLEQINAKIALIPVGNNNRYGHPTNEVIETLTNQKIQIFRTDKHGAVQYQYIDEAGSFFIFKNE
ncbi:DNA internalization-related competence protein ComEC/Rec2 [Oceanobacillus sp. CAU 1775]